MSPPKGPLRLLQLGSVRQLTPSCCTRSVAWPIHVTVASGPLSRSARRSGTAEARGATRDSGISHVPHDQRMQALVVRRALVGGVEVLEGVWPGAPRRARGRERSPE